MPAAGIKELLTGFPMPVLTLYCWVAESMTEKPHVADAEIMASVNITIAGKIKTTKQWFPSGRCITNKN